MMQFKASFHVKNYSWYFCFWMGVGGFQTFISWALEIFIMLQINANVFLVKPCNYQLYLWAKDMSIVVESIIIELVES